MCIDLKYQHRSNDRYWPNAVLLDSSYLRHPQHQAVKTLMADDSHDWGVDILNQAKLMDFLATPYAAKTDSRIW